MADTKVLFCWERSEENSWNPELAEALREAGLEVTEVHDLAAARDADPRRFDLLLPRFPFSAANMACVDDYLVRSGVPMLNSREVRMRCENKALAHQAFEERGIPQAGWLALSDDGELDREPSWDGETLIKPLWGSRGAGIETFDSVDEALERALERGEDLLVQEMIWPARSWRVIVGRHAGAVDPYWRRPPSEDERILSISTGSTIARERSPRVEQVAVEMLEAVDGDILAVDVLEAEEGAYALEINHNFDAHGGTEPAVAAFLREIEAVRSRHPQRAGV